MKIFKKKGILYKAILSLLIVFAISGTVLPTFSQASVYGELFAPIQAALVGIGDAVMWACQKAAGDNLQPTITVSNDLFEAWLGKHKVIGFFVYAYKVVNLTYFAENKANDLFETWLRKHAIIEYIFGDDVFFWPDTLQFPTMVVSPETIFSNSIPLIDANIINPSPDSAAYSMKNMVSSWYKTFRNIAAVGLLSVLVYIAIRILISATATDKAKYKEMLKDWAIAFCLLFFMHYIMSFATTLIGYLTYNIGPGYIQVEGATRNEIESKYLAGWPDSDKSKDVLFYTKDTGDGLEKDDSESGILTFTFTEFIRFNAQTEAPVDDENDSSLTERFAWTVMYLVMVIYTVMFLFIYIKRMVYIVLLTMIAPLVALSYPLDKMKDRSAQGFNKWLQEYLFNLLIQPLHLILYTVLIGSSLQMAVEHPIYALIVMGFMLQTEKVLRKLFGFDKSSTASTLMSGAMGGAVVMKGVDWLSNKFGKGAKAAAGAASGSNIRTADKFSGFKAEGWDVDERLGEVFGKPEADSAKKVGEKGKDKGFSFKTGGMSYTTEGTTNSNFAEMNIDEDNSTYDASKLSTIVEPDGTTSYEYNGETEGSIMQAGSLGDFTVENEGSQIFRFDENTEINGGESNTEEFSAEEAAITGPKTIEKPLSREINEYNPSLEVLKGKSEGKTEEKAAGESDGRGSKKEGVRAAAEALGFDGNLLKTVGKGVLKGTAGIAGAATLGTIGVAAGIASDDFTNVAKYGIGGAVAGGYIGNRTTGKVMQKSSDAYRKAAEAKDAYDKVVMTKEEYQKKLNDRLEKQLKANNKIRRQIANKLDLKNGKDIDNAVECFVTYKRKAGIKDNDNIMNAMKIMKSQGRALDDNIGLVGAKFADQQYSSRNGIKDIQEQLGGRGYKKEQIKQVVDVVRGIKDWKV